MDFKDFCILVLWSKVASALERLQVNITSFVDCITLFVHKVQLNDATFPNILQNSNNCKGRGK